MITGIMENDVEPAHRSTLAVWMMECLDGVMKLDC